MKSSTPTLYWTEADKSKNPANVKKIMEIMTEAKFKYLFPKRLTKYSYKKWWSCPTTAIKNTVVYYGRGPFQISHNYNYGPFSLAVYGKKSTLLNAPKKVATNGDIAFLSALWFYMTPQNPKP